MTGTYLSPSPSSDLRNLQLFARFGSPSGEGVTNAYDGFGRLTSAGINQGGTTRTLTYQHDRNGSRTRITHPDGQYFAYAYDGLARPTYLSTPTSITVTVHLIDCRELGAGILPGWPASQN